MGRAEKASVGCCSSLSAAALVLLVIQVTECRGSLPEKEIKVQSHLPQHAPYSPSLAVPTGGTSSERCHPTVPGTTSDGIVLGFSA